MFINRILFLATISRDIKFGTIEMIVNQRHQTLLKGLTNVMQVHHTHEFVVTAAPADGEFEHLCNALAANGMVLNTTTNDENVGDVERYIRTIKERVRATYSSLPFKAVPPRLVIEMADNAVFWLNSFPASNGILSSFSPHATATGQNVLTGIVDSNMGPMLKYMRATTMAWVQELPGQ